MNLYEINQEWCLLVIRENHLRWYGHVQGCLVDAPVRIVEALQVNDHKRDRPKTCLVETLDDMFVLGSFSFWLLIE